MSQQRGLSWSKKWHIINPDHPDSRRYGVGRCGAHVYRDDHPHYPAHLTAIKNGTKKSAGLCKLCTRSSGIKTVTVELPEPDSTRYEGDEHGPADRLAWGTGGRFAVSQWPKYPEVQIAFDDEPFEPVTIIEARRLAACLLAAANAAEANA